MTSRTSFKLPASALPGLCLLISLEACAQNSIDLTNGWWSPFTVTGYAEAYYDVDFNRPPLNKTLPTSPRHVTSLCFSSGNVSLTFLSIIVSGKALSIFGAH
jgi:hypothetical protein